MLNEFNEGGSHETNPLGGIPQGMGQNNQMNTVEQGETKKDDFIYSDRIRLTPDVVNQFSLPKSLANKTAAEATKIINNKFEGRNSKIDMSTKQAMLDRIAEAQETVKQIEQAKIAESMQANSTEVPDQMNGEIPQGMEEFLPQEQMMYGGNKYFNGGEITSVLGQASASGAMGQHTGINQITTALDLGNTAFGKTGIDTSGATNTNPGAINPTMMGVTGAMKGAQAGMMFGPIGAGVGGAVGLTAGLVGGNRAKRDALKGRQNFEIGQSNKMTSNFAYGGKINKYSGGGPMGGIPQKTVDYLKSIQGLPNIQNQIASSKISQGVNKSMFTETDTPMGGIPQKTVDYLKSIQGLPNIQNQIASSKISQGVNKSMFTETDTPMTFGKGRAFGPQPTGHTDYQRFKNATDKTGQWFNKAGKNIGKFGKENYADALRLAPVAMNAFQLNQVNKRGYDTVNPIINNARYNPQYMDERALTNQINAESNYAGNALANASSGSLGMLSNNILGSQLNKTRALSDAYSKIEDVNRNENRAAQQFNLGVDEANIGRRVMAEDLTARNKGVFLSEQSKYRDAIGQNLGSIGKEQLFNKLVKEGFGYTRDGKYVVDNTGQPVINPETNQPITKEEMEIIQGKKKDYKAMFSAMNRNFKS